MSRDFWKHFLLWANGSNLMVAPVTTASMAVSFLVITFAVVNPPSIFHATIFPCLLFVLHELAAYECMYKSPHDDENTKLACWLVTAGAASFGKSCWDLLFICWIMEQTYSIYWAQNQKRSLSMLTLFKLVMMNCYIIIHITGWQMYVEHMADWKVLDELSLLNNSA